MIARAFSCALMLRATTALTLSIVVLTSCATDVRMKPLRSALVYGTIRDPQGQGIPGMTVALGGNSGGYEYFSLFDAETDSAGNFQMRVPEGEYLPTLMTENYSRVTLGSLRVKAPTTRFDYTYGGYRVGGNITGPGGAPVDSGVVHVWSVSDAVYVDFNVRFSGGRYEMYLNAGDYSLWFVPYGNAGLPTRRFVPVPVSADTTIDVLLDGHAITGTVTLGPGAPMSGATIQAAGTQVSARVETGAAGTYTLYLPTGDYDWRIAAGAANQDVYPLYQAGPGVSGPGTLDFDLSGVDWTGVVRLGPSGAPVSGAQVSVDFGNVFPPVVSTTDGAGAFHLILRPARRYFLRVSATGAAGLEIPAVLAGNDSTFDITLSPAGP
jgi:carboxypeptidase family protein